MNTVRSLFLGWAVAMTPMVVQAQSITTGQSSSFVVGDTTLAPGTGEKIIDAFAPALRGRGQGPAVEAQLNPVIANLGAQLQADVLNKLNALNFVPFMHATANAGGMVARAFPIDYATKYRLISFTVGATAAVNSQFVGDASHLRQDFNQISNGQAPNIGGSADASVLLGINLAAFNLPQSAYFDPDRMQIFISAMRFNQSYSADQVQLGLNHYGVHGKYQLFKAHQLVSRFNFVRWGGLNVATGLTYDSQDVTVQATLPGGNASTVYSLPNMNTNVNIQYAYSGSGTIGLHGNLYTIPLEVSSSLQLLYFFTLYGGGAADFSWGQTALTATASEPTHVTVSNSAGTTLNVLNPQPQLTFSAAESPATVVGRGFFGFQINAGVVALFEQISFDTTGTLGVAVGLRAFY